MKWAPIRYLLPFSPGVPEGRTNPLTPRSQPDARGGPARIAEYHGRILDQAVSPYYSRESFDDYYLGKGIDLPGPDRRTRESCSSRPRRAAMSQGVRLWITGL